VAGLRSESDQGRPTIVEDLLEGSIEVWFVVDKKPAASRCKPKAVAKTVVFAKTYCCDRDPMLTRSEDRVSYRKRSKRSCVWNI